MLFLIQFGRKCGEVVFFFRIRAVYFCHFYLLYLEYVISCFVFVDLFSEKFSHVLCSEIIRNIILYEIRPEICVNVTYALFDIASLLCSDINSNSYSLYDLSCNALFFPLMKCNIS